MPYLGYRSSSDGLKFGGKLKEENERTLIEKLKNPHCKNRESIIKELQRRLRNGRTLNLIVTLPKDTITKIYKRNA